MEQLSLLDPIESAIAKLALRLPSVNVESYAAERCMGRVLAQSLLADRDSPAIDVSAMDGYAIRLADAGDLALPVAAVAAAGEAPKTLPVGAAIRIFTGAAIPQNAECVIRREDTVESINTVRLHVPQESLQAGQNIRRRGENTKAGDTILEPGALLSPPAMASIATFSPAHLHVHRRVRIAVLNTGDELAGLGAPVEPWQIRDSNGPLLESWLSQLPWVEFVFRSHVGDTLESVQAAIEACLPQVDAILLTGGVSMGDTDHVPAAIEGLGGEIAFHRLPIRPGRPVLGASLNGKLLLGLPGNPVSVAVTSRVIGLPLLRKLAGILPMDPHSPRCVIANPDDRTLQLMWYRLVKLSADSQVQLIGSQGSGDLVSLSQSDGFAELPAGLHGSGPWRVTWW